MLFFFQTVTLTLLSGGDMSAVKAEPAESEPGKHIWNVP